MRTKLFTIASLIALAAQSQAMAQQASAQNDQANSATERQTTSTTSWTTSSAPPEQAGDLYQTRTGRNGDFGNATTRGDPLPGALDAGMEPLGSVKPSDPKE